MPRYPDLPGTWTSSTSSRTSSRSGVATSRCSTSAIALRRGLLHALGALEHVLNRHLHVKRLLGNLVVLAVHDLLEAADRVRHLHILAGEAGELFGHVE